MGLEGSEAPAQETQLLGPRRGWGGPLGPVCSGCFYASSVNPKRDCCPLPLFLLPFRTAFTEFVALCPRPFSAFSGQPRVN